jgi:hypothetical protein
MALISLGMPVFNGTEDDDFELFVQLFLGYLHSVNVNPFDRAGNPSGQKRAMGILRSCMQGPAAIWFDRNLTGKNWKVRYINKNGNATLNALRALIVPEGAGGPNAGTYVNPSPARTYAGVAGNALHTIGEAFIPPENALSGEASRIAMEAWRRSGGEPTTDVPNILGPAGPGVGNNGQPIVFDGISLNQAFAEMRSKLPALLEQRRRLRFNSLSQDGLSIREFHDKLEHAGSALNYGRELINEQFFRGLTPENILEVARIGSEKPVAELVDILEQVESRKAEMDRGLARRNALDDYRFKRAEPVQKPPVSMQEPLEIKPVTSHAITQDMLNKMLQQHTENLTKNFQSQLQTLQEKVVQPAPQQVVRQRARPPPVPPKDLEKIHDFYESHNPFDRDPIEYSLDDLMRPSNRVNKIAERVARKLAQAEERRQDKELVRAMQDLGLGRDYDDGPDNNAMDIDLVRIGDARINADDLNEYIANLIRSQKKR